MNRLRLLLFNYSEATVLYEARRLSTIVCAIVGSPDESCS